MIEYHRYKDENAHPVVLYEFDTELKMNESGMLDDKSRVTCFASAGKYYVGIIPSCENCGNHRCRSSVFAWHWDECVHSGFKEHWKPIYANGTKMSDEEDGE